MINTEIEEREFIVTFRSGAHKHYAIENAKSMMVKDLFTSTKRDDRFITFELANGEEVILNTDRVDEVDFAPPNEMFADDDEDDD